MNAKVVENNLHQSPFSKVLRAALIATTIVTLFVLAFTWPTKTAAPKDLSVSISGSATMVEQVKTAVNEKSDGAIKFIDATDRDKAVQQIKEREAYGAIVLSEDGAPEVLTAPAASTATSTMLGGVAQEITAQTQAKIAEAKSTALTDGIDKGKAGIKELQTKVDTLNTAVSGADAQVKTAKENIDKLTPELIQAQTEAKIAQQQIDTLSKPAEGEAQVADLARTQIGSLQSTVEDSQQHASDIQTQISESEKVVSSNGGPEAQAARDTLEKLNPKLADAKEKVAQAQAQLDGMDSQEKQRDATTAKVTSVADLSEDDPNGAGLTVAAFPLVIAGMLGGILILNLVQGLWSRLAASTIYAALSGLFITLILHTWFGFVQGNFALLWLAFVVSSLATSLFIIGIGSLLGVGAGAGLGALITMLIGNPIAGAATPWEYLAKPFGAIGQHMVPGASTHLLRSISYFPEASTAPQWFTLLAWCVLGLALALIGYGLAQKNKDKLKIGSVEA